MNRAAKQTRGPRFSKVAEWPQAFTLILGDCISALMVFGVIALVSHFFGALSLRSGEGIIWVSLWVLWRGYQGLYPGYGSSPQTELRLHTLTTIQLLGAQLAAAFATKDLAAGGMSIVLFWILLLVVALIVRYGFRFLMIRAKKFGRPISIVGAGRTASLVIRHLQATPAYGLIPVAAYDDNPELQGTLLDGIPVVGPIAQALGEPLTYQALITIPGARAEIQERLVNEIYAVYPLTWVVPDLFGVPNQAMQPHNIGSVASLEIKNNLRSIRSRFIKRSIDLLGAMIGGVIISPVLLLICLAIKLDSPGPVLYKARRLGRDGEMFDCFKFRSMHKDAEAKLKEVLDADPVLRAEFEATHKLKDDPRVTRVGALLRKTSLDELPQLANVLNGTMSLVGPRPIVTAEIEKYGEIFEMYKQVRPGMTGYWQANGRSDTSYDERVGMDRFYITNWSVWLDVVILIQTVRVVILGRGAY